MGWQLVVKKYVNISTFRFVVYNQEIVRKLYAHGPSVNAIFWALFNPCELSFCGHEWQA